MWSNDRFGINDMPLCLASLQALSCGIIQCTAIDLYYNPAAGGDDDACAACGSLLRHGLPYGSWRTDGLVRTEVGGRARIRHRQEVSDALMDILCSMDKFSWKAFEMEVIKKGYGIHIQQGEDGKVYGYSIMRGNSRYKASELGRGRNLMASKIEQTWAKLHPQERKSSSTAPVTPRTRTANLSSARQQQPQPQPTPSMRHYDISTDSYHTYHIDLPEEADRIIRQECSLAEAHPLATIEEIQHTAILLFAEYLDAATSMATSSGGGGSSDSNGWGRKQDEDDREWARRCARKANRWSSERRAKPV